MLKDQLHQLILDVLHKIYPDTTGRDIIIEYPNDPTHGDYSCNIAMQLAKPLKKSPREVAQTIVENLAPADFVHTVEIAGPGFINFFVSPAYLVGNLRAVLSAGEAYGTNTIGKGKKVMVEYSQPNTNKPMHIGHMRNNFVGMAVVRLLRVNGYEVIPANYVGDIGVHIAKSMLGYLKWGKGETPESADIKGDYFVGKFYQQFEAELENDKALMDEAQAIVRKWEENDPETRALWEKMNQWVYDGWNESYERQGCRFEKWYYESEYNDSGKVVAEEALEKGVAFEAENGAIIAKLEDHGMPDKVLLRGDGTSIYATKDLKLAEDAFEEYGLDGRVYVVASQQKTYLEQIFKILELMGYDYAKQCFHLAYGIVSLPEGMMSSRKGTVIYADDLMNEVNEMAYDEVAKRNEGEDDAWLKDIAEEITVGAIKYGILRVDPFQNIVYDAKATVQFEGDTGPYLQYTHARLHSILRKAAIGKEEREKMHLETIDPDHLRTPEELAILRKLQLYPELIVSAAEGYRLHSIATYLNELGQLTNTFYSKHPVLDDVSAELRTARLHLIVAVAQVLKNGLAILGISAPEKM